MSATKPSPPRFDVRNALAICLSMHYADRPTRAPRLVAEWLAERGLVEVVERHTWASIGVLFDPAERGVSPFVEMSIRLTADGIAAAERANARAQEAA